MVRCAIFALLTICIAQDAEYITAETENMDKSEMAIELLQLRGSVIGDMEVDDDVTADTDEIVDFDSDDDLNFVDSGNSGEQCDAFANAYPDLVTLDFGQADNSINNLGGIGPQRGAPEQLYYKRVATAIGSGDEYDLKVSVRGGSSYKAANTRKNGQQGHFGTINLKCGTSVDLDFQFFRSGEPATLDHFFFSWFDIDQGVRGMAKEEVILWPGYSNIIISSFSELDQGEVNCPAGAGAQTCKSFSSSTAGGAHDNPTDPLALTKLQAMRTFSVEYKQVSSFTVTLKAGRGGGGRLFTFSGESQVAYSSVKDCCPDHICGCPSSCAESGTTWTETCTNTECSKCDQCFTTTTTTTAAPTLQEEACKNGLTFALSSDSLVENTLGRQENGRMLFKGVLQYEGRSVDLSVTDVSSEREYRRKRRIREYNTDRRGYTGEYNGAGRVAFDEPGRYMLRFMMLDSNTGEETKLPLFPFVMYDVDGKGELITACGAAGAITHDDTALTEREWQGCFYHKSTRREANIPADFDSLTIRQKKVAVTYVYRNTGSWDIGVTVPNLLDKQERYVLFGSSKVLACDYEDKIGNTPWKNKGRADEA